MPKFTIEVPYPELPEVPHNSGGRVTQAEFDRAFFLRNLAELRAGDQLTDEIYEFGHEVEQPHKMFMIGALMKQEEATRFAFDYWMAGCGGMAGPGHATAPWE